MVNKKIVVVTQARVGSTRLPSKVLLKIGENSLLDVHLIRLKKSKMATKVIVATTFEVGVENIIEIANRNNVSFFQGSTEDVLDRFYQSVKDEKADYIVRVTSDCPLIDAELLDSVVQLAIDSDLDYCSNQIMEKYPDGQDVEVVKFTALETAWRNAYLKSDREHVTPYIRNNSTYKGGDLFRSDDYQSDADFKHVRMTVDEEEDFRAISLLVNELGIEKGWKTYAEYVINNPEKFNNQKLLRNEGYYKSLKNDING